MLLKEVIGHEEVKKHLVSLVQQNRLSHALLFLAREGAGGLPLALAFSQYILCNAFRNAAPEPAGLFGEPEPVERLPLQDSCGVCQVCVKAQKLIHPDIHYSFPVIPKKSGEKPVSNDYIADWRGFIAAYPYGNVYDWLDFIGAENKQGNITAAECNDINRKLSLKAFEGQYKILVMWMPEHLGNEGNKLLKLIEEPPPDTIFILVAEDETAILPTILSRTQLIKVPILSNSEVSEALQTRTNIEREKAVQIAGISEGNYREALQLLQHAEEDWLGVLADWLKYIHRKMLGEQFKWVEDVSKLGREKQKQLLRYFIHLIELAIKVRTVETGGDALGYHLAMPEKERDFALRLNRLCSLEALDAITKELNDCVYYIERNAHAKMLFHALTIRISYIIMQNSVILVN